jgi:hypothetical protein
MSLWGRLIAWLSSTFSIFWLPVETSLQPQKQLNPSVMIQLPSKTQTPPSGQIPAPQRVYDTAVAAMGKHLTLDPAVPAEVGCCEALSVVLHNAGYQMPPKGIPGVNAMIAWMLGRGFPEIDTPEPGDIIAAHSPDYTNPEGAHIGVLMKYGICSNTGATGLWAENYRDIEHWRAGFPQSTTRFFRPS